MDEIKILLYTIIMNQGMLFSHLDKDENGKLNIYGKKTVEAAKKNIAKIKASQQQS